MEIGWIDTSIIIIYLIAIVGIGCWAGIRARRKNTKKSDAEGYFLAGGTLTWPIIGLALFSTNISTIHLVGFAEEGFINGLAVGNFEWMAPFTLIITALFFAPFYIRSKVATLPDFLEMRYNRPCRDWLAVLSIISAIFIHIGFSLYTGAIVLNSLFGIDLPGNAEIYLSISIIAGLVAIYTIVGGLAAVVVTESIETLILLTGAIVITVISLYHVGGWSGMTETLQANNEMVKLTVLRSAEELPDLPWYAVMLGYPVIGIWYWCADQTIVQRILGAKNENHARVGPLFAGFIKILPVFLFILPGLIFYVLVQQNPETFTAPKDSGDTYAAMIKQLLPVGVRGIVAAALLAALMGTVSGALNSIATLFSYDIVKRWRPDKTDKQLVRIGRIVTFIGMIIAILWSPFIAEFKSLYQGIIALISYIAPPITTVFLLGVLWRRASSIGAQLTLYIGSFLGLMVFVMDLGTKYIKNHPEFLQDKIGLTLPESLYWEVPALMASFYLCMISFGIHIVVSFFAPHEHTERSEQLVWKSWLEPLRSPGWPGIGNYKFLAALLFVTMIVLYWIFR